MATETVLLSGTISVTDTTITPNATIVTRNFNNPALNTTSNVYSQFLQIGTALVTIPFPPGITIVYVVYVRNLHATNNVLVNMTPNGGSASNVAVVAPGGMLLYFQTTETAGTAVSGISNGITSLSVTASAASTPVEVMIGA